MNSVLLAAAGWLIPGGAYLVMRRYLHFAAFAVLVTVPFALGLALHGGCRWPQPAELQGLDNFTALAFQAGSLAKALAGGPYLLARAFHIPGSFLEGRVHEYGATLLMIAGALNLLAISSAFDLRKEEGR